MLKNAIELNLNGDTFANLKEDFNSILDKTVGNMESKGAEEATITLKLCISLEKETVGRFDNKKELTKPTFKHDITSVMQIKNKASGSLTGDYELVWDEEEQKYVMRQVSDGQLSMFDDEEDTAEDDTSDAYSLPESAGSDIGSASKWLSQFTNKSIHITEAMGNYTARAESGEVILTSASPANSIFHCDAESLEPHVGHELICTGYIDEAGRLNQIGIRCIECSETIFKMEVPEETIAEEGQEYDYDDPEEYEEDDA